MASIRDKLVFFPFKVKQGSRPSLFYKLSIPFLTETVRKTLTKEVDPYDGILSIENFLKEMRSLPLLKDSFLVDMDNDLYIVINEIKNFSKKVRDIFSIFGKYKGIDFEQVPFSLFKLDIDGIGNINFIEVLDDVDPTGYVTLDYDKEDTLPLLDRVEFYDDRPVVFIELEKQNTSLVKKVLKISMDMSKRFGIFMHIKPLIVNGKIRIKGVFQEDLFSIKDRAKEIRDYIYDNFKKEDRISVYFGILPVLAGTFDLDRFKFPIIYGYWPVFEKNGIKIDDRIKDVISKDEFIPSEDITFVGRLREIEKVTGILSNLQREDLPYLINITGILGVGKTKFVEEVLKFIENEEDVKTFYLRLSHGITINRYTLISTIAKKLNITDIVKDTKNLEEIQKLLLERLRELSRDYRLILVLDNADYIDDDTLSFMKKILTAEDAPPFFVVLVSRERRIPQGLLRSKYSIIELNPMTIESVKFMVLEFLSYFPSKKMLDFIYSFTQGIPLYVVEMLTRLKREGKLEVRDDKVFLKDTRDRISSLEDMLISFYEGLRGSPVKVLLDIISVFGDEIPLDILKKVFSDISPNADFEGSIKSLMQTSLVEFGHVNYISPAVTITFKNSIFRDIIQSHLPLNWQGRIRNLIIKALLEDKQLSGMFKYRIIAEFYKDSGKFDQFTYYMLKLARLYEKVNEYNIIKELLLEVLPYEKHVIDKFEFYKTLTYILVQTGDYKEAETYYKKIQKDDEKDKNFILFLGIVIYSALGNDNKVKELINKIDFRKIKKKDKYLIYHAIGVYYSERHNYKKALQFFEKEHNLIKKEGTQYVQSLLNMAHVLEEMGEYYKALDTLNKAISSVSQSIYHADELMALYHNKAVIHIRLEQYDKAISALDESLFWAKKIKLYRAMAYIYNTRKMILVELGKYKDALKEVEKAYTYLQKTEDDGIKGAILASMGFIQTNLGEWREAYKNLQESLEVRKRIKDYRGISHTLFYLGELERQREQYEKALDFFRESMSMKEKVGHREGMLYVLAYNALLHIEKEEFDEAYKLIKKGIKMYEEVPDKHAYLLLNLALAYSYLGFGEIEKSKSVLSEVNAVLSSRTQYHLEGFSHYIEGLIKLRQGDVRQAFTEFLMAREKFKFTGEKKSLAKTIENLIDILANHSVYYMGSDTIIEEAKGILEFYESNGLLHRAKTLSLNLSKL